MLHTYMHVINWFEKTFDSLDGVSFVNGLSDFLSFWFYDTQLETVLVHALHL